MNRFGNQRASVARLAVATGLAVTVAAAGVDVAQAASGHSARTSHTMRFVSKQLQDVISHDIDVATDKNTVNGKTKGYDVTSCAININTHMAKCTIAVARPQGILFGRAKVNVDTSEATGTVTGGTAGFRGATGTITGAPGPTKDTTSITVHYEV